MSAAACAVARQRWICVSAPGSTGSPNTGTSPITCMSASSRRGARGGSAAGHLEQPPRMPRARARCYGPDPRDREALVMRIRPLRLLAVLLFASVVIAAQPEKTDKYADTIKVFRDAGQSAWFFTRSYGYAVFPTIGKGGIGIGGAHGSGRV